MRHELTESFAYMDPGIHAAILGENVHAHVSAITGTNREQDPGVHISFFWHPSPYI